MLRIVPPHQRVSMLRLTDGTTIAPRGEPPCSICTNDISEVMALR
jgi:hypothetical protein